MKQIEATFSQNASETDWDTLGKLDLSIGPEAGTAIERWVREILAPLDLPGDLGSRILQSAQNAVAHSSQSRRAAHELKRIHLLILAPQSRASKRGVWGFFRIEKIESEQTMPDPTIEFYLYQEG